MDNEAVGSADLGSSHQSIEHSSGLDDVHNARETVVVIISEEEPQQEGLDPHGSSNATVSLLERCSEEGEGEKEDQTVEVTVTSEEEQQEGLDPNGHSNEAESMLVGCSEKGEGGKEDGKVENESCVIDLDDKCGNDGGEGERVCRICHLSPEFFETEPMVAAVATSGLIQLGCGCKDELGTVHVYCAEAWFKLKGNRQCEICGETAKNVKADGDNSLTEECNETRSAVRGTSFSARSGVYLRGQPFCNFLMACLVIAFVLPWFFRVNVF